LKKKFSITGDDLIDGEPENCQYCAVALAVARDLITDLPNAENLIPNVDGDGNYYIQEKIEDNDGYYTHQDRYWIDMKDSDSHELLDFISWFDVSANSGNKEVAKDFQEHVVRYDKRPWEIECKLVEVDNERYST
tara:strand:- start:1288 stop:1692 length:405 start_codon:yes stop_codon:yes gene_type:complete